MSDPHIIFICLICSIFFGFNQASYKFNSLHCSVASPEVGIINLCEIKAIDRYHNKLNMELILKKNLTRFEMRFRMVKRESGGWHPFLYNMKVDVCKFFQNPSALFIPNLIYSFMKPFTNLNHTCPYLAGSVLGMWDFTPNENGVYGVFPVDHGQYGLHTDWYGNNAPMMQINGSVMFYK